MNEFQLDATTKILEIKEVPQSHGSLHQGIMYVKTQRDEFDSVEETRKSVWIWEGNKEGLEKALNIWQTSVSREASLGYIRYRTNGSRIAIIINPGDCLLQTASLTEEDQAEFAAAISFACIQLCNAGLAFTQWNTSCVAKVGTSWKILPTGNLKVTGSRNLTNAMSALGKWFWSLRLPLFQTEPALSIIKLMYHERIPDEMYEEITSRTFWQRLENIGDPLQVQVQTTDTNVNLSWNPQGRKVLFRLLDPEEVPPCSRLIFHSEVSEIGQDFCNHSIFHPTFRADNSASWSIPTSNSRYKLFRLLPLVVNENENWYQPGVPFWIGGPPDVQILDAWLDSKTDECVLSFNWAVDPLVRWIKIVFRTDRYAETPDDFDEICPVFFHREPINYPLHIKISFQFKLYITVFSLVELGELGGCKYYSSGQSRTIISRTEEQENESPKKRFWG